ncbi:MAG: NAD-glutamate dehydrogenase domain-containing protein, partial [Acidimicrobiales bacterium]
VPAGAAGTAAGAAGTSAGAAGTAAGAAGTGDESFVPDRDGPRLVSAIVAALDGATDVDGLNCLVTAAGMNWRQVMVMRAYRRYRRQAGAAWTDAQLDEPLVLNPEASRSLLAYFEGRFDPNIAPAAGSADRLRDGVLDALAGVASLGHDEVLRGYLRLIDATLRTSYFIPDPAGGRPTLTLKLDSRLVPDAGAPRLRFDTFVHGPAVEGIHLRAGLVARGGIRWSDRPDDFRTEILDLAQAQVKKNAIIVPTGAKGGFVCRRPMVARGGGQPREAEVWPAPRDVAAAYTEFVRGLLDVTDDIVGDRVERPPGVRAVDGDDAYLVVAADRGTATFSDLANSISAERGFWLGDAFASGGSRGYDHKAMGITARGAWVAVRRHFHQLGIDVQSETVRVVGVGDMSGDVFGNGMLQSDRLALVAAFDHRHVFIDPEPDVGASYLERRRLAALERSSWADYTSSSISAGGGVWARSQKSIPVSPQAAAALGIDPNVSEQSPPELIPAILAAPVDLVFFGGIGTFVKAPHETDAEVGDHANDAVRITSDRVRARVVAEGGNLAVTQRARIRYSRRGGRLNTDFIDNAAGVATSDREVNLKILLAMAVEQGELEVDHRDRILASVEPDVAFEVLRQVDHSVAALDRAVPASARELDAYAALINHLQDSGRLNRDVESLPTEDELAARRGAGAGLIRPELAVLLAYAKSDLVEAIEASDLVRDDALAVTVGAYFPRPVTEQFGSLLSRHRLYGPLLATDLAGEVIDQMGIVWAHETAAELDRDLPEMAAAFWAARQVLDAGAAWAEIEATTGSMEPDADAALHRVVTDAVAYLARCYLTRPGPLDIAETVAADHPVALTVRVASHPLAGREEIERALVDSGVAAEMAARYATTAALARIADVGRVAAESGWAPDEVLDAAKAVDDATGLDRLDAGLGRLPPAGRWATWQARALRDNVTALRRRAVEELTASRPGGRPLAPRDAVDAWAAAHSAGLQAVMHLLDAFEEAEGDRLTVASLALRSLSRAMGA